MSRYVRSKYSEQATVWKLDEDALWNEQHNSLNWRVNDNGNFHYLPRSEYIEVPAPEVWVDVTSECSEAHVSLKNSYPGESSGVFLKHGTTTLANLVCGGKYRLVKVKGYDVFPGGWAFRVERKQP